MLKFVHLHCHSHFSLLNGLTQIKPLVKTAKKRGYDALALTDYGSMYGAIKFYQTCLAEDVKPIIGFEAYMAPRKLTDKDMQEDKELYRLILLAENYEGYKNLMKLSSFGHLDGFFNGKPRIDKGLLRQYHTGIIALSGNIEGEIPQLLKQDKDDKAMEVAKEYNDIFGVDNFYLELQDHPAISGQMQVNTKLIQMSKDLNIPMVVTRDVHYLNPDDAEAQDILRCISEGWKVNQSDREDYRQIDRSLNTAVDIFSRFKHVPEAIENTVKIADRINLEIPLDNWHFAPVDLPPGKTSAEVLRENTYAQVGDYYSEITQEIKDRIEYELSIIEEKGYSPYFICVADYVQYAKDNGIIETTRGSAAGSVVSYVNGITTVDPIRFKLPFERFLNPFRPSPPDIDTDFADDRRDEMIEYMTKKYGSEKVAQIITFGTMAARAAVRDVGRALAYSYSFCDQVAKLIPMGAQGFPMTIERALKEEPDLKKLYDTNEEVKKLLDLAQKVEGCARHTSIHAAGVVVSPTDLTDFTPIQRETGGDRITTQYEMKSVETAGVLKNDFLGIRNLSILGRAVEIVRATTGEEINVYNLPLDDEETFSMISRGETLGTFQLGGTGMTQWIKELKPTDINDIMAMVALYRPGPMESIPEYIRRKYNPDLVKFLDPRLEKILDASYGLLVYQDDVMLTAIELAGYDWMEADKFRKAMGKKIPEEMAKQKEKFYDGCKNFGKVPKDIVDQLWTAIEPFAAYGFNKCLVGGTLITDPTSGIIKTIKNLYEENKAFSVLSLDNEKKLVDKKVSKIYLNGKKKTWKLKTRTGREIVATDNHPFLKFDGWSELSDLKMGDRIALPRVISYKPSLKVKSEKLRVLGFLLSEGNLCHPHGVYFYSSVKCEVDDFIASVSVFNNTKCTVDNKKKTAAVYVGKADFKKDNGLMVWIKKLGLWNKKAVDKRIPDFVFCLSQTQLAEFVATMWQGDGCISDDRIGQIYYATSSQEMVYQLQHLLLRFGIVGTVHTKSFKYRGGRKIGYTLNISRFDNILKFSSTIGKYLLQNKKKVLDSLVKKNKVLNGEIKRGSARGTKDIIPQDILFLIRRLMVERGLSAKVLAKKIGVAERLFYIDKRRKSYQRETIEKIAIYLQSNELLAYARSDIYWDEVVLIKDNGIEETYDLTVPGEHNYVANDFIVHNSHAASYGIVAYQTAYMKAHYPVQYMTAVLQAEFGDADKVSMIVRECKRMGIQVLPPDINESFRNFAIPASKDKSAKDVSRKIRFGLNAIKNVGEHICDVIYTERKKNGPYKSLENFLERIEDKDLNKKSVESLAKSGAMDSLNIDRGVLLANIENILGFIRQSREKNISNQDSLFSGTAIAFDSKVNLQYAKEATLDEKIRWEKDLLAMYVSAHPFDYYEKVSNGKLLSIGSLEEIERDKWVVIGGVVEKVVKKITKKGAIMMFVTIQDTDGSIELLVFPKTYEKTQDLWQVGNILCVVGKTPKEEGDNKIFVEKAELLTKENAVEVIGRLSGNGAITQKVDEQKSSDKSIVINITKAELEVHSVKLKQIFLEDPGKYQVFLRVGTSLIKANSSIDWHAGITSTLEDLIGKGKIEVFE